MKKIGLRLAVLLLLSCVLVISVGAVDVTPEYRGYASHNYIPRGQNFRVEISFEVDDPFSTDLLFGTQSALYRADLTGDETQEELNAMGREILRSGTKYVQYGLGYSSPFGEYAVDTERLEPGSYLAVAYCYTYQGEYLNPYNVTKYIDKSFSVAVHVVEKDIPIQRVDVYLCDEKGENRQLLDPSMELDVSEGKTYHMILEAYPKNATWRIHSVLGQADMPDFGEMTVWQEIMPGEVIEVTGSTACGTGMLKVDTVPLYQSYETKNMEVVALTAACVWDGHSYEVIKESTCTEEGERVKWCRNHPNGCPTVIETEVTPAKGHIPSGEPAITQRPTATKPGVGVVRCERCQIPDAQVEIPAIFSDTKPTAYYSDAVDLCYENGIVNGLTETTFGPSETITRAQMVTLLYRLGMEYVPQEECPFTDVNLSSYYGPAVQWAYETGIAKGITETEFAPKEPVTRQQLATFLYRYAQYRQFDTESRADLTLFSDAGKISSYAVDGISWAVSQGLINGMTPETLGPKENAQRAQFVTILYRLILAHPESF